MNPTEIAKIELPMPITTPRLLLRIPQLGEGKKMYEAIKESFNELHLWIPWATKELTIEQCEEFIRQSRTNWVMRTNKPLGLPMFIFDKNTLLISYVNGVVQTSVPANGYALKSENLPGAYPLPPR